MTPAPSRSAPRPDVTGSAFDLDAAWQIHPQVAVRPERFGALLYHFGTRQLSFLKNRTLLAVVQQLTNQPSARAACHAAGVSDTELPRYQAALATLAASRMIAARSAPSDADLNAKESQ